MPARHWLPRVLLPWPLRSRWAAAAAPCSWPSDRAICCRCIAGVQCCVAEKPDARASSTMGSSQPPNQRACACVGEAPCATSTAQYVPDALLPASGCRPQRLRNERQPLRGNVCPNGSTEPGRRCKYVCTCVLVYLCTCVLVYLCTCVLVYLCGARADSGRFPAQP
jgi:hypothetical protein